ncbi:GAF and ANTAR domain-containing protein [Kribbella sp. NPDC004875]|uniref:GAF and ANTAR domain-containing protein n=1 Tax=Kribbella sp. NPDC004875 TaxID=3364107 RepID=UPI0036C6C01A
MQPGELAAAEMFALLATELRAAGSMGGTVDEIIRFALHAVHCTAAGMVLVNQGSLEIAATTDPSIEALYKVQVDGAEGPLLEAIRSGRMIAVVDARTEDRWDSAWSAQMAVSGFRSVVHLPLPRELRALAVLSLYGAEAGQFGADDLAVADVLAEHATAALAAVRAEESLRIAVDARDLIGQAKGILMERFGLDADQAFAVLRRYSQSTNTKLRAVAQQLIDTRNLPS